MDKRPIFRSFFKHWTIAALIVVNLSEANPVSLSSESMSGFTEAIQLEEQLSNESRQWDRQKRILENEIQVLQTELEETQRRIESIQSEKTEARERREELLQRLEEEQELSSGLRRIVDKLSAPSLTLIENLPTWSVVWKEEEQTIEETSSPIGLLRFLQEVQAENSQINVRPLEVTDPESGEAYRVDLLTVGLGAALFASENGQFGGRFIDNRGEWTPQISPEYSGAIRRAILQEKGTAEPSLLNLPISLSGQ